MADAYLQSSRFDDAQKALDEGLAIAEKNDDRSHEAELHRLKGELALAAMLAGSRFCRRCFRRSLLPPRYLKSPDSKRAGAGNFATATSLAHLFKQHGRIDEARALLSAIHDSFKNISATPDLADTAALLDSLHS